MCGVFGAILPTENAADQVLVGLKTLEYRGYDSWGVCWVDQQKQTHVQKATGKIGQAQLPPTLSHIALGHTRWATHGGVTQANAHPHLDCTQKIVIVHNGIVENYQELKASLQQQHIFLSETDTEVIAHLLEEAHQELPMDEALLRVFSSLEGLNALVVLDTEKEQLFALRRGSPLVIGKSNHGFFVCSDTVALAPYQPEIVYLPENLLVRVTKKGITGFDENLKEASLLWKKLEIQEQDLALGTYKHYLDKEIREQPKVLRHLATRLPDLQTLWQSIWNASTLHLVGCGTAYHACLAATYYLARQGKLAHAYIGSEFGAYQNIIPQHDQIVFVSQSGETIDLVEHAQKLKSTHKTLAMINRPDSSLSRLVTATFLLEAGVEQCVLATKSFTAKLATWWATTALNQQQPSLIAKRLVECALAIETVLGNEKLEETLKKIVDILDASEHLFSLGRGPLYPVALEAALKIKEVTYLHAEGFAGGELKHGTLALISSGTPCLVFLQEDGEKSSMLSNASEMKSRGAVIIGVATENNEIFDHYLPVPDVQDLTSIPLSVVGQLIAYRLACKRGLDPDKPRNIAKSVVVK